MSPPLVRIYVWKPQSGANIMLVMAPPKKPAKKPAKKRGPVLFITMDEGTDAELHAYLAAQDVAPDRSAVGLKALREFLVSRGFKPDAK